MAAMIYHLVPEKLIGMRLIPLNRMSGDLASQHASGIAKYSGREKLLQRQIPKLDCLWNDVLHFSSVDPRIVFGRLEELGLGNFKGLRWFKVPVELIAEIPTVVYRAPLAPRSDFKLADEDIERFDSSTWQEPRSLTNEAEAYFQNCVREVKRPLPFQFTPHVLVLGEIEVGGLEIGGL